MAFNKKQKTAAEYVEAILRGDRILLGRAITLVESKKAEHQKLAQEIIEKCLPRSGNSIRIGITGSPGVGKSSFIETFGTYLIEKQKRRPAVLAIDPSSQVSRGSILGDKMRMEKLSTNDHAFIRPSPAGTSLGGVAAKTRETMLLCEAAGFDTILIETVGVGQSEVAVHGMVDFFLLLLLPGAGDELQGIKRGIVEMADLIAINKADGERTALAKSARKDYAQALHLFPPKESGWTPKAVTCSALQKDGIENIWKLILDFQKQINESGWFKNNRQQQAKNWFYDLLEQGLKRLFFTKKEIAEKLQSVENEVLEGRLAASKAANGLLELFTNKPPF
ncbi:MAG TPA: methylmalonyl Co-A mutase-associated GTPase MeaB [Bacteroidetes bacterium]|nr:methylmalonyl Co-A mutase-associated GTPase MeaB [Bacteroidota bacterium]